jgi:hypothetical protein
VLRWLVEDLRPEVTRIVLVDNLNSHTPACLYAAFKPARLRALAEPPE